MDSSAWMPGVSWNWANKVAENSRAWANMALEVRAETCVGTWVASELYEVVYLSLIHKAAHKSQRGGCWGYLQPCSPEPVICVWTPHSLWYICICSATAPRHPWQHLRRGVHCRAKPQGAASDFQTQPSTKCRCYVWLCLSSLSSQLYHVFQS